ncbi:hypothetical protein [Polyangium jinanense]|uniref:Lipoprotein n=1 Tax=Polyangium jinanense TaxID=2829994 RepID=A0A9X3WXT9_9BACT|nr:hypothetical protein [Polyangium jinanense]MDC3952459.1 hypothetical protein [Polyangium jinanense]MDC3980087.1 hypothetical protein [Polyangium jinanense]
MKHRNSWVGLALVFALASACRSEPPETAIEYGEPVGLRMATKRGMPDYEIAVAVSKGTDVGPLVPALGAALHAAVELCPEIVQAGKRGEIVGVWFRVEQGAIGKVETKGVQATCVTGAIGGKPIAAPDKLAVLAEIRFPSDAPVPTAPTSTP